MAETDAAPVWGKRMELCRAIVNPTIAIAAYAAGQCIGGLIGFPNLAQANNDEFLLQVAELSDAANQKAAIDLLLFDGIPANSTFNDAAAAALAAQDLPLHIDTISFQAANYISGGSTAVCSLRGLEIPIMLPSVATLYAALICRGTPTYTAKALNLKLIARRRP